MFFLIGSILLVFIITIILFNIFKEPSKQNCEYLPEIENYKIDCLTAVTREGQCYFYIPSSWDIIEPIHTDFAFQNRYRKIINPLDTNAFIGVYVDISATYMLNDSINTNDLESILYSEIQFMFNNKDTLFEDRKNLEIINKYPIRLNVIDRSDDYDNNINEFAKSYIDYIDCTKYQYPSFKITYKYNLNGISFSGYKGFTIVNGVIYSVDCVCKTDNLNEYEKDFSFITSNFLPTEFTAEIVN